MAQANVPELEPATTVDGEREHDRGSGYNKEVEQDGNNGGGGDDEEGVDLMERFQIACRIVDLRFDIKDFIDTYFRSASPRDDPELQREAIRRLCEEVERKKRRQQQQLAASSQRGGDLSLADGDDDDDLDEQTQKLVRACGFADRMAEVDRIIDTYFDEDLDAEACQAAIDHLWGKLDKELEARFNAVIHGEIQAVVSLARTSSRNRTNHGGAE